MIPSSRGTALAAALAAFAGLLLFFALTGRDRGDFRIDEAHKLSETRFLRLLLDGDFRSPEWRANIVDRTNPPLGKYLFGIAALLAGETLPEHPSLSAIAEDGLMPGLPTAEHAERYRPLLRPARRASMVVTAATGALLVYLVMVNAGAVAGVAALLLWSANFLTLTFAATAVFDPLFAFFLFAAPSAAMLAWSGRSKRALIIAAVLAAVLSAFAFQTRLNGAFVLLVAVAVACAAPSARKEWRTALASAALALFLFLATALAVNPYYWAPAGEERSLLPRVASRVVAQATDGAALQKRVSVTAPRSRVGMFTQAVGGDGAGLVLLAGAGAGLAFALSGRLTSRESLVTWWSLASVVLVLFTVAAPWPRYFLGTVAPLSSMAGVGLAAAVRTVYRSAGKRPSVAGNRS